MCWTQRPQAIRGIHHPRSLWSDGEWRRERECVLERHTETKRERERETVIEQGEQTKWQSQRSGCIKSIHKKRTKMSVWKHLSGGVIHSDTAPLPQWVNSCNHSSAVDINSLSILLLIGWSTVHYILDSCNSKHIFDVLSFSESQDSFYSCLFLCIQW